MAILRGNYIAGFETVSSTFSSAFSITTDLSFVKTWHAVIIFIATMLLHPEVQKKAQEELDAVVGPYRLPGFEDRGALVYINAIVKESIRWHNVVPVGVGHCITEDDEFQGYFLPAGAVLVPNVW